MDPSVRAMVFSQLLFFSAFGLVQTVQVGRWATARPGRKEPAFAAYELVYVWLSMVTKLALAGAVVAALRPEASGG